MTTQQVQPLASLVCPACGKFQTTAQENRGKTIKCPKCEAKLIVGEHRQARTRLAE